MAPQAAARAPGDIWHVDYNATVAKDAAMGWQGMGLVLGFNTVVFLVALLVFHAWARSTRFSLFRFATTSIRSARADAAAHFSVTKWAELLWRTPIRDTEVEAVLGPEGTFYLLYELYAFKLLAALSVVAALVLLPLYLGIGVVAEYATAVISSETTAAPLALAEADVAVADTAASAAGSSGGDAASIEAHWWSFAHATIRVIPNQSPYLWIPVGSCYVFTLAFGIFYYQLHKLSRIPRPLSHHSTKRTRPAEQHAAETTDSALVTATNGTNGTNGTKSDAGDTAELQATSHSLLQSQMSSVSTIESLAPPPSTREHLFGMQPSPISHRSLFIDRGIPKTLREDRMLYLMDEVFPGYVEDVAMVYNLGEFHSLQRRRRDEVTKLERARILHEREMAGEKIPLTLRILPGSMQFPSPSLVLKKLCCWRAPPYEETEHELKQKIEMLRDSETACLSRILRENRGAGRAFVIFKSPRMRARFVRRVQNQSITSILARFPEHTQHKLVKYVRELGLTRWHMSAAPEPDDIDWQSVSFPFAKRTIVVLLVNAAILTLLLLFTSPVAVTSAISSSNSYSTNAAQSLSDFVWRLNQWVQQFSPQMARMMTNYIPTLILVMINGVLLNVLHHAGRIQPISTDSAKERMVLRSATIYLMFNTIFLPSLAFVSIDAVLLYLENEGEVLDMLGSLFLRNTGIFYVDYVLQRCFLGTAVILLRTSELFKFSWEKPRAVTPRENVQAVEAWPFFTGTQTAMQISTLTVVLMFSTVVPLILPIGALYFGMQHAVDKYSLIHVRRRIKGRGSIARTATHATMVSLLLYQAGMSGFFLIRGTSAQYSSVLVLLMATYIIALWAYIQDKEIASGQILRGGSYSYLDQQQQQLLSQAMEKASDKRTSVAQPEDEDGELQPLLAERDTEASKSGSKDTPPTAGSVKSTVSEGGDKELSLSDLSTGGGDASKSTAAAKPPSRGESSPLVVVPEFPFFSDLPALGGVGADSSDLYREPALRRFNRMSFGPRDVGDYGTWRQV